MHSLLRLSGSRRTYDFILAAGPRRETEIHLSSGDLLEQLQGEGKTAFLSGDVRLLDYLQEGDSLQYICDTEYSWVFDLQVRRFLPAVEEKLPVCTEYIGKAPPVDAGGVRGYQVLCKLLRDKADPRHRQVMKLLDKEWFQADSAEKATDRLHGYFTFY